MSNFICKTTNNYVVETKTYPCPPEKLIELFSAVEKGAMQRNKNYNIENLYSDFALCYTLSTVDGEPWLGSMAWNRPFYGDLVRVTTRYCVHPKWSMSFYRRQAPGKGFDNMRVDVVDHIDQQVDFCKKLGFESFFLSMEDNSPSGRRSKKICTSINKYSKYEWKILDEQQRVAPGTDRSCWQQVIYNNLPYIRGDDGMSEV